MFFLLFKSGWGQKSVTFDRREGVIFGVRIR